VQFLGIFQDFGFLKKIGSVRNFSKISGISRVFQEFLDFLGIFKSFRIFEKICGVLEILKKYLES
jgi:hypothetical protein